MEIDQSRQSKKRLIAVVVPGKVNDPEKFLAEKLHISKRKSAIEYTVSLAPGLDVPGRSSSCSHLIFSKEDNGLVGAISDVVNFTTMPDFVYSDVDPATHIHPFAISSQVHPQVYIPTDSVSKNQYGEDGAASSGVLLNSRWLSGLLARFNDSETPVGPSMDKVEKLASDSGTTALLQRVRELFQQRPVWQMTALEEAVGETLLKQYSSWKVLEVIRSVSYFCVDGPFRNTHISFGYDPRKDPESRFFQSIDFRDPWFKHRTVRRAQANLAVQGLDEDMEDEGAEGAVVDCHFRVPPVKRNQCYQFCDIEDSVVQTILKTSAVSAVCLFKPGWFTDEVIELIRGQLKIRSEELRKKAR